MRKRRNRPKILIDGPGVLSISSKELSKTYEYKRQLEALVKLSRKVKTKPARYPGD